MPDARDPLKLVGVLARRGEDDLRALAGLIRGQPLEPAAHDRLRRAGLLRAGPAPRLPANLIAPVLALEAALGLRGAGPLAQLVRLLQCAGDGSERSTLLGALAEQLFEHLAELDQAPPPQDLRDVLDDLRQTVEQLSAADADPAEITRVSALCARLIERLAGAIAPRRPARVKPLPIHDPADLAAASRDQVFAVCRPLRLPTAAALARALLGPDSLPCGSARRAEFAAGDRTRQQDVLAALAAPDPLAALYAGQEPVEALRRHARLIAAGPETLRDAGVVLRAEREVGPAPIVWCTRIEVRADARGVRAA